jgi:DNA-binding response OmpR family regulator
VSGPAPRILVVDDEPSILGLARAILEPQGYRVSTAGDGREALRELAGGRYDLVLTDIVMPDMEGIELLRRLRSQRTGVPVVVMSGNPVGMKFLQTARHLGASGTLHKPFSIQELTLTVERALR